MKMLVPVIALSAMFCFAGHVAAQDFKARLAEARSTEQVRKFYSKFSELGPLHEQEFQADGVRFFTVWVSRADREQLFLWAYQKKGEKWVLLVDEAGAHCVWSFSRRCFIALAKDGGVAREYKPK